MTIVLSVLASKGAAISFSNPFKQQQENLEAQNETPELFLGLSIYYLPLANHVSFLERCSF